MVISLISLAMLLAQYERKVTSTFNHLRKIDFVFNETDQRDQIGILLKSRWTLEIIKLKCYRLVTVAHLAI